jgi:predicted LPLAT superfamily acyltransferase
VPVYFASLLPEDGRYRLVIERAPESGWEGLVDYYLDRLEHNCRIAPAMWDNWPAWNQAPSNS